jgi:hypothetical protein
MRHIALTAFFLGSLLLAYPAYADEQGIQLSPAIFEDKVDPGKQYNFTLNVRNVSSEVKTFYLFVRDIKSVDDAGKPQFATEGESTLFDLSSWVTLGVESVVIPPGLERAVSFSVRVPTDATPGAHFGGIFIDSAPPKLRATGAGVGVSVGSLINLQISGDVVEDARLRAFSTGKLLYTELPADIEVRMENLGNTLIRPTGFVEIINMFGKQVANIRVNENASGVYPGGERSFKVVWDQEDLAFGRYQAVTSMVYGGDVRKTVSASISFWVLPLALVSYFFGGILVALLILYFGVRTYIRRQLAKMGIKGGERTYDARYGRKMSQTTSLVLTLFIFCVLFLFVLLVLFA